MCIFNPGKHSFAVQVNAFLDAFLFSVAFVSAYLIRFGSDWQEELRTALPFIVAGACLLSALIYITGQYAQILKKSLTWLGQGLVLAACTAITALGVILLSYLILLIPPGRGVMVLGSVLACTGVILHHFLRRLWNSKRRDKLAFIVASEGDDAKCRLLAAVENGSYALIGIIKGNGYIPTCSDRPIIGTLDDLPGILDSMDLDRVLCTAESLHDSALNTKFCQLRYSGVPVVTISSHFEELYQCVPNELVSPHWLLAASGSPHILYIKKVKRAFDIVTSIVFILLLWPILLIAMIAIKLTSHGPVIFRQVRCGRLGQTFELLKLRTMVMDAEANGPTWSTASDPRVTWVGKLLRKFRVDEIPQLLNVLRGEMSFVGPRPERPEFIQELSDRIPFYKERQSVPPGITGWAQVNYPYGASVEDAARKLEYDLYYMKYMSLLLDILILLDTVYIVVSGGFTRSAHANENYYQTYIEDAQEDSRSRISLATEGPVRDNSSAAY